jgi:hypothetical protein
VNEIPRRQRLVARTRGAAHRSALVGAPSFASHLHASPRVVPSWLGQMLPGAG